MSETVELTEQTFKQRRYEQIRREQTASDIGRTALAGYERRGFDELSSGIVEALSGRIDSSYSFELVDGQFVAEDGEPIEDMLLRGLRSDMKKASNDAFFQFLPSRSRAELDNFRKFQAIARGEIDANTQIEISPYTEHFDTSDVNREKLVEAAQKPYWGRTMVRVSYWDGQKGHILTLSSDNLPAAQTYDRSPGTSSVAAFKEASQRALGYQFQAGDAEGMLSESIILKTSAEGWQDSARSLVKEVDNILFERHGGEWKQGRLKSEAVDLQEYVLSQTEALAGLQRAEQRIASQCSDYEAYKAAFDKELYKCVALLEKRLELGKADEPIEDYEAAAAGAGAMAEASGKVYDMCGAILTPAEQSNAAQQTGSESLTRLINKKINCPECYKKVVVPASDLKNGKLSCTDCGYWLDVCTGRKGFTKRSGEAASNNSQDAFEPIYSWFKKDAQNREIKRLAETQARQEIGDNVTYLDKKRYEKQIRQNLERQAV